MHFQLIPLVESLKMYSPYLSSKSAAAWPKLGLLTSTLSFEKASWNEPCASGNSVNFKGLTNIWDSNSMFFRTDVTDDKRNIPGSNKHDGVVSL